MKTGPLVFAAKAKGPRALFKRVRSITRRYGLTPKKMDQALHQFARILGQFNCGASFALTTVVLERHRDVLTKYLDQNIEFIVHGYTHIDYSLLSPEEQLTHLRRARHAFAAAGIQAGGFRSPYLRCQSHLYTAIEAVGFSYTSNQPVMWDVLDASAFTPSTRASYQRAIDFYTPWLAGERPSLPRLRSELIEIPVSLPDDEILIDRLHGESNRLVEQTWRRILSETYRRGELFAMQLHPERIALCAEALSAILTEARAHRPPVWVARLDEIAAWWRARATTTVDVKKKDSAWQLSVAGPPGTTFLVRGVETVEPAKAWINDYRQIAATTCTVQSARRPFIGVSPASPLALASFLRQQGYIVQISDDGQLYPIYLDRTEFAPQDERLLLTQIAKGTGPLVRLGRWPNGARSALAITGDIDALTIWGYGLRLFGR